MKIVNIMGGLGNQMFEYAFALSLKAKFPNEEVMIDTSHYGHIFFKHYKGANLHNGFEIHKVFPNADLKVAKPRHLMKVTWYMPNYVISRLLRRILPVRKSEYIQPLDEIFAYLPEVYEIQGDCYFEGIWESVHYLEPIRDIVQHIFAHPEPNEPNKTLIGQMELEESVGIHVRRGDYVSNTAVMDICDLAYYQRAIDEILRDGKNHTFFVFSNDMKWCEENIAPMVSGHQLLFVKDNTGKNSCWDMFLMTHCKELVIANSSFSWWGAFLNNRGGRVVAPNKWINRDVEFDVWLDQWIKM